MSDYYWLKGRLDSASSYDYDETVAPGPNDTVHLDTTYSNTISGAGRGIGELDAVGNFDVIGIINVGVASLQGVFKAAGGLTLQVATDLGFNSYFGASNLGSVTVGGSAALQGVFAGNGMKLQVGAQLQFFGKSANDQSPNTSVNFSNSAISVGGLFELATYSQTISGTFLNTSIRCDTFYIGHYGGTTSVTIDGSQSAVVVTNTNSNHTTTIIGLEGTGSLSLSNGASFDGGITTSLGVKTNTTPSMGTLSLATGASFKTNYMYLGYSGTGNVNISGMASAVTVAKNLQMDHGTISITGGGSFNIGVDAVSSTNTLSVGASGTFQSYTYRTDVDTLSCNFRVDGTAYIYGKLLVNGATSGTGTFQIEGDANLELNGFAPVGTGQTSLPTFVFTKGQETLTLDGKYAGQSLNIKGFTDESKISFTGYSNLTSFAVQTTLHNSKGDYGYNGKPTGEVDIYSDKTLVAKLYFDKPTDALNIVPRITASGVEISLGATPVGPQDPTTQYSIDWAFLHTHESALGRGDLAPYVPGGNSRATIGQGVDLVGREQVFFDKAFGPDWEMNGNLKYLEAFLGLSHAACLRRITSVGPAPRYLNGVPYSQGVSLTVAQTYAATLIAETEKYDAVSKVYERATKAAGTGRWSSLTENQRTVIIDIAYLFGDRGIQIKADGALWSALVAHDWTEAGNVLLTTNMEKHRATADQTRLGKTAPAMVANNASEQSAFGHALYEAVFAQSGYESNVGDAHSHQAGLGSALLADPHARTA